MLSALIYWQIGEKQPCCLAATLPDPALAIRYYGGTRSVWFEEMFGGFKKHGFDL